MIGFMVVTLFSFSSGTQTVLYLGTFLATQKQSFPNVVMEGHLRVQINYLDADLLEKSSNIHYY